MFKHIVFVFFFLIIVESRQRWHTSQILLEKLYDLQKEHFNVINGYLDIETKRLEDIKKTIASTYEWHQSVINDVTYLHNHINSILTMKRISQQMSKIEVLKNNGNSMSALNAIDKDRDLSEGPVPYAILSLRRLQQFYRITASEMVTGKFMDRIIGDEINACECYVISKHCFENYDMIGALDWGFQAHEKWIKSGHPKCIDIENLDFYIVVSSTYVGFDYRKIFEQSYPYSKNTKNFKKYVSLMSAEMNLHDDKTLDIIGSYEQKFSNNAAYIKYKAYCKHGKSDRIFTKDSHCRYQTKNSFYRILMPFKEEDVASKPLIKLYHDVLYDGEIQNIIASVKNKMKDADSDYKNGIYYDEKSRSAQNSWIDGTENFELINLRVEYLTGLSLKSAELYQFVNYGLGGHIHTHTDGHDKNNPNDKRGSRIATIIFYLSDAPNDGYTVFPIRGIVIPVKKGTALFWYNLRADNGKLYQETYHGSCPILKGNKMIINKFLRERGQILAYDWTKNV